MRTPRYLNDAIGGERRAALASQYEEGNLNSVMHAGAVKTDVDICERICKNDPLRAICKQ